MTGPAEVEPVPDSVRLPGWRRFIVATVVGWAITAPGYLWVLWDLWSGSVNPLRTSVPDNFYDLQARAMLSGHLWLPPGSIGIEAFVHAGRQYTYFGLFPSLLRMPVLLATHSLDGRLTAPSLLLAWLATAVFSALLLWRLRVMVIGGSSVSLGRMEAATYAMFVAAVTGGSVLMALAARPVTPDEDLGWSVALSLGSFFCLLGVLERPSWRRAAWAVFLVVSANLDRVPTGYACDIAAVLCALWLWWPPQKAQRRYAPVLVVIGLTGLLASSAVSLAKFGAPFGLPEADQVWTQLNAHRRHYLEANGGAFNVAFLPSTMLAYLGPGGLHLNAAFPFIDAPPWPARAVGHVVLDQTYRTPSFAVTEPLLFLFGIWGLFAAFRRRAPGGLTVTRPILVAGASAAGAVFLFGYIAGRYLADLLPFFVPAGATGLVDLWRRAGMSRGSRVHLISVRRLRTSLLCLVAGAATWSVIANTALALEPTLYWSPEQVDRLITVSHEITPGAVQNETERGPKLPYYAPAGTLFAVDGCSGLYWSTGERFKTSPGQYVQHATWMPIEQAENFNHDIDVQFNDVGAALDHPITIFSWGQAAITLVPAGSDEMTVVFSNLGAAPPWPPANGWTFTVQRNGIYRFGVMTDPNLGSMVVSWFGTKYVGHFLAGDGPAVVHVTPDPPEPAQRPAVTVTDVTGRWAGTPLCHALIAHAHRVGPSSQ